MGVGATLPDANTQAPVSYFTAQLQKLVVGSGYSATVLPSNQSVNGSIAYQFPAAFNAAKQALAEVKIDNPGTGYAVGDFLTVNQGIDPAGEVIVTSVGAGGSISGLRLSSYTNSITDADLNTPSTGGYTVANNVPVFNGTGNVIGVAVQTGVGSGATVDITRVGITPTVVVFAYGMNDGGVYQYHAGETFPGFMSAMQSAMQQTHAMGADCIVLTTPHPEVVTYASSIYDYPSNVGEGYPVNVPPPVSPDELVPTPANSNVTQDFLHNGTPITLGYRFLQVNQAMRTIAAEQGCTLIDAELDWMQAIQQYQMSSGSATGAEAALFNPGAIVHPNLLGHQLSYWKAIDAFLAGLSSKD